MEDLGRQAVEYFTRMESWTWWEKVLWGLAAVTIARFVWWLIEYATNESKSAKARFGAGMVLLACVVALMGSLAVLAASVG